MTDLTPAEKLMIIIALQREMAMINTQMAELPDSAIGALERIYQVRANLIRKLRED